MISCLIHRLWSDKKILTGKSCIQGGACAPPFCSVGRLSTPFNVSWDCGKEVSIRRREVLGRREPESYWVRRNGKTRLFSAGFVRLFRSWNETLHIMVVSLSHQGKCPPLMGYSSVFYCFSRATLWRTLEGRTTHRRARHCGGLGWTWARTSLSG